MISSFRALGFASRVLSGEKKHEDEKGREREGRETVSFSLYRKPRRTPSPKGAFFSTTRKRRGKEMAYARWVENDG